MKIPRPLTPFSPSFAALFLLCATLAAPQFARADGLLVLQRADGLFTADASGTSPARRVGTLASPADARWAISADGRRMAILSRTGVATAGGGMAVRPAVVAVSERGGRHRKRLFGTDTLRDRQGHAVTELGLGADAPVGAFADWEPIGLSWSADSRTLYVSCRAVAGGTVATFAVDGASGLALVDAQEHWKAIAPLVSIDARGGRLVGIAPTGAPTDALAERSGTLTMIDLAAGVTSTPVPASGDLLPRDAAALDPALSPDERRIVLGVNGGANSGLFLIDRKTLVAHRSVVGAVTRPRWTPDGKSLYFLLLRPGAAPADATTPPIYDLYAVDSPASLTAAAPPAPLRLVLQGVDWFDVVPE